MNSRGSSAGGIGSSQSGSFRPKSMAHGGGITARSYHGNIPRSNGAGGGGGGGGKEALFYPAQPLHRIRSTGAAEEGHGLSQDPNFSPPIRLPENGDAAERPSTRGDKVGIARLKRMLVKDIMVKAFSIYVPDYIEKGRSHIPGLI